MFALCIKNNNTFEILNQINMKKLFLSATIVLSAIFGANSQAYYNVNFLSAPGNPGGVNTDVDFNPASLAPPPGSTTILSDIPKASSTPKYSTAQTIPFVFQFNGGPVTSFKANSSGYLTFSKVALSNAGNTPAALPSALLPDSSVCVWGLCLAGLNGGTCVYTKVYGTAPHRQLWINWFAATNPVDTCSINWWAIVLEEGSNNIYMVDQAGGWFWNGCSNPPNPDLTLGVQISPSVAFEVAGSPSITAIATTNANSDNNYYEFVPGPQPAYDAKTISSNIVSAGKFYGKNLSYPVIGNFANLGSTALTGLTINWAATDGNSGNSAGAVSIAAPNPVSTGSLTCATNWQPTVPGVYNMKIWATALNGSNANQDPNDTLYINGLIVIDSIQPKTVLFEEFNQASCDPCALAKPNIDSVCATNAAILDPVRLHVNWPGLDYMNDETQSPFIASRVGYYNVNSVPDGKLDGMDVYPGYGYFGSSNVQTEAAIGSPFKVTITSAIYNKTSRKFTVTANIKAYGPFNAGLMAGAYITVDTINYVANQSTESIPQYNFPQVAEDMMPSAAGTTLAAFTSGQTQTLTLSWTKNHAWGLGESAHKYDSTGASVTIFVQDNTSQYIYQCATSRFSTPLGVESINNGVAFNVY